MGIVAKQSIYNLISIGLAFLIGAVNMLFLYPTFPGREFQGLIVALLANSNLVQPFISFGVQHTLIKFFSDKEYRSLVTIPEVALTKGKQNCWVGRVWIAKKLFRYSHP